MKKLITNLKMTLISVSSFLFICGCENNTLKPEQQKMPFTRLNSENNQLESDTTFLCFEGNLHEPEVIWQNSNIYFPAYERMARHLKFENNRITWKFKNADELHISQNIYDYVIFMWNLDNEKLASGDYILETKGIYFKIIPKNPTIMPLASEILIKGMHRANMRICIQTVRQGMGPLMNYIDLEKSDLEYDGWAGARCTGGGTTGDYSWTYALFVADINNWLGVLNSIATNNAYMSGGVFWEKVMNIQHAPLVTVTNANYFH